MSQRSSNPYRRPDSFTQAAKAKGYPARSVFKLEEIDKRTKLFRKGQHVLDLGAAPGSWSMYAAERIGPTGKLLAMDLSPIEVNLGANTQAIQGDALALSNEDLAIFAPYNVVMSDMAPATTGSREADQYRSYELVLRALTVAEALGAENSHFVAKIFMSNDFTKARDAVKRVYQEVRTIKPEGTRSNSYEVFLIGLGKRALGFVLTKS